MATNNPFNTTILNEVRPTYIGPPLESINLAREHLTKTFDDNATARGLLDQAFANTIAEVNEDPEAVNMIIEHKNNFERDLGTILDDKNMAYAGNTIQNYVNKFTGDARIAGRRKNVAEFNGYRDAIRNNKNISNSTKRAFLENIKYANLAEADDNNFLYSLKEFTMPYERVDINEELLKAARVKLQFPDMTSWSDVTFIDVNGKPVTNILDGDVAFIRKSDGTTKSVTSPDLKSIFDSVINNNDAARGYLLQEAVVGDYYRDNSLNPVERLDEIYNNPDLMKKIINNATSHLANALEYNQTILDNDVRQINTNLASRTSSETTINPRNPLSIYSGAINTNTLDKTEEDIRNTISTTDGDLKNIFNQPGLSVADDDVIEFNKAVANNDRQGIEAFNEKYHIDPESLLDFMNTSRRLQAKRQIANTKIENARNKILFSERTDSNGNKQVIENYPSITSGIDINDDRFNLGWSYGRRNAFDVLTEAGIVMKDKDNMNLPGEEMLRLADKAEEAYTQYLDPTGAPNNELKAAADKIRNVYNKEYKKYKSELDKIIESENFAHDEIITDEILGYGIKGEDNKKQLTTVFSSLDRLKNFEVYNSEGKPISPVFFNPNKLQNLEVQNVYVSPTRTGTNDSPTWVVDYTYEDANKNPSTLSLRIPMDEGSGVEQKIYKDAMNNNKYNQAIELVNQVLLNNAEGTTTIPFVNGFDVIKDTKTGKTSYKTPTYEHTSRDNFTKELSDELLSKDLDFDLGVPGTGKALLEAWDNSKDVEELKLNIYNTLDVIYNLESMNEDNAANLIQGIINKISNAR